MNPTKTLLVISMTGIMAFVASTTSAVQGVVTISGTAYFQDQNGSGFDVSKTHSINQATILQLLAEGTGDSSITNIPTKLYYNPDQFNEPWYNSSPGWYDPYSYGVFYYSNSVAGMTKLQGYDYYGGPHWSYIELDSYVATGWLLGSSQRLGISDVTHTDYNRVLKESNISGAATGNAVLYIHSNPYLYNQPANHDYVSSGGYYQKALVIQGMIKFNGSDNGTKVKESFSLQGSGDGMWYDSSAGWIPVVIKGSANFNGTGPSN